VKFGIAEENQPNIVVVLLTMLLAILLITLVSLKAPGISISCV
jgi:hypothetical protein